MPDDRKTQSEKNTPGVIIAIGLLLALAVIILWSGSPEWLSTLIETSKPDRNYDQSLTSLFAGLAFVGALVAVFLQRHELIRNTNIMEESTRIQRAQTKKELLKEELSAMKNLEKTSSDQFNIAIASEASFKEKVKANKIRMENVDEYKKQLLGEGPMIRAALNVIYSIYAQNKINKGLSKLSRSLDNSGFSITTSVPRNVSIKMLQTKNMKEKLIKRADSELSSMKDYEEFLVYIKTINMNLLQQLLQPKDNED